MPTLAYRRRMTRRIVGGFALVWVAGYLFVLYSEDGIARAHAERYRSYQRILREHRAREQGNLLD